MTGPDDKTAPPPPGPPVVPGTSPRTLDGDVGLSFIDVLYGLAATQCFQSAFHPEPDLTAAQWAHFAVALAVVTLSWVGYHLNRLKRHRGRPAGSQPLYFAWPFRQLAQLLVDVYLLALYFLLAVDVRHPPDMAPELRLLVMIFAGYVAWTLLDIEHSTAEDDGRPMFVDLAFWAVFAAGLLLCHGVRRTAPIVVLDAAIVLVLLLYRLAKGQDDPPATKREPAAPTVH
jgi:hypothetical protein